MTGLRDHVIGVTATRPYDLVLRSVERVERLPRTPSPRLVVLTYHRIGDPATAPPGTVSATPESFEQQMAYLARTGLAVSGADVVAHRRGERSLPPESVLVTFDDAYVDVAEIALPILRRHGIPMVLFVPTAYPDSGRSFWWDRAYAAVDRTSVRTVTWEGLDLALDGPEARRAAYRRVRAHVKSLPHDRAMAALATLEERLDVDVDRATPPILGWDRLREVAAAGVELAPHSQTHPLLDRITPERAHDEIAGSAADLLRETGTAATMFAYPSGHVDPTVRELVAGCGIDVAFTTRRGVNRVERADWLCLLRLNVGARTTLPLLRTQMLRTVAPVLARLA